MVMLANYESSHAALCMVLWPVYFYCGVQFTSVHFGLVTQDCCISNT